MGPIFVDVRHHPASPLVTDERSRREVAFPPVADRRRSRGPLDLLLHLIRVNEVSITDIPIAADHGAVHGVSRRDARARPRRRLGLHRARGGADLHQVEDAASATRRASPGKTRARISPRRLLEYERFKQAAESFHEIDALRAGLWPRPETEVPRVAGRRDARGLALRPDRHVPKGHGPIPTGAPAGAWRSTTCASRSREKMLELVERLETSGTLPLLEFLGDDALPGRSRDRVPRDARAHPARQSSRVFQTAPFAEIHATRTEAAVLGRAGAGYLPVTSADEDTRMTGN